MSDYTFRFAEEKDAPAISQWVAENSQIDPIDVQAGLKTNSPTAVYFVVEKDGKPVAFAPFICVMQLCHLGFDPEARAAEKLKALNVMLDGAIAFAVQYGIRQITTLTKEDYGIAKWAAAHGFEKDGRDLFRLDINKLLPKPIEPPTE